MTSCARQTGDMHGNEPNKRAVPMRQTQPCNLRPGTFRSGGTISGAHLFRSHYFDHPLRPSCSAYQKSPLVSVTVDRC